MVAAIARKSATASAAAALIRIPSARARKLNNLKVNARYALIVVRYIVNPLVNEFPCIIAAFILPHEERASAYAL